MSKPSENRRTLGQESSRGVVAHTPTIRPDNDRPLNPDFFWECGWRSLSLGAHFLLAIFYTIADDEGEVCTSPAWLYEHFFERKIAYEDDYRGEEVALVDVERWLDELRERDFLGINHVHDGHSYASLRSVVMA